MQSEEDVARAMEGEAAFHARLNAARCELEDPNPQVRYEAAVLIGKMTCNQVDVPRSPDDHLWLGNWQVRKFRELDRYMKRVRSLWHNEVVKPWRDLKNAS